METLLQGLLVAGITSLATVASAWLSYNYRISKELFSLNKEHLGLSKEHVELRADLSSEHKDLSKEHVELREALGQKIQSASGDIKNYLEAERREQDRKLEELKQNQLLEKIQQGSMASEVVLKEYLKMQKKLHNLQINYEAALDRIEELEAFINTANQTQNKDLEQER